MPYPSSLTDNQWKLLELFFPAGNKSFHDKRILIDAVLYITKTGCQWRQLPNDFPNWKTVYSFFIRAKEKGHWEKAMNELVRRSRNRSGKLNIPTYCIIDSQSVKTTNKSQERGIDGGKKNKGKEATYCR
jgi:putative transposase